MPVDIDDPRIFPSTVDPAHAPFVSLAEAALAAAETARADDIYRALTKLVLDHLRSAQALLLAEVIASAPSPAVARAFWRCLIAAWSPAWRSESGIAVTLFGMPIVVIAGRETTRTESGMQPELPGIVRDTDRLSGVLRECHALCGNQNFALARALVASDALDVARLGDLMARQRLDDASVEPYDFPPAPIALHTGQQGVHLRFLMGTALAAADVDLLSDDDAAAWGMPFARELGLQLSVPEATVLALPRAPRSPPAALQHGRMAQREVGAQLFASNAIRRLRATVGEPIAVISAHHCTGAPGGGELRLSLSSVFDPRQAEGFRCPLFATDRASNVAGMLLDLLTDCRVSDVRVLQGVHPDRDPNTGALLLFKPTAQGAEPTLH